MVAEPVGGHLTKPFFLNAFFVLLLTGCQSLGPTSSRHHEFAIEGKIAVRSLQGQHSARFRWQQDGPHYRIELWGPLGQGRTILEGDGRRLRILDPAGRVLASGPVRSVMQQRLGWYLPLESLPEWVLGNPISGLPIEDAETDSAGRITGFRQLGWTLGYSYLADAPQPRRIAATMEDYRVILVVNAPAPANTT